MLATSSPEYRTATVAHLVVKWRIAQFREQPGIGHFQRRLGAEALDLALLAYRISSATDARQASEDFGGDLGGVMAKSAVEGLDEPQGGAGSVHVMSQPRRRSGCGALEDV
jgi:hypothetical protein